MKRTLLILAAWVAVVLAAGASARAEDAGDARLRSTLRSTMQQLQDAQNQLATLQAQQGELADEKKTAADQLAILQKRISELQADSDKSSSELKSRLAAQAAELQRVTAANEEWKTAQAQAAAAAKSAAAERDRAMAVNAQLQRQVDDLKTKNLQLFDVGNQILTRFEKFSLGEQFMAKEPFIGRSRVKLENLIQDYDDKLRDQLADK